jgi:hypothetical protein
MYKKITFFILFLFTYNAFADEASNVKSLERQLNYCKTLIPTRDNLTSGFKCDREAWLNFGSQTRFNALKSGSSNLAFVLQQVVNLLDDASQNANYSKADLNEKSQILLSMYSIETDKMFENFNREISEINELEAKRNTNNFIFNLVNQLNGKKTKSDSNSATYIINGRIINCRSTGAFTNCF